MLLDGLRGAALQMHVQSDSRDDTGGGEVEVVDDLAPVPPVVEYRNQRIDIEADLRRGGRSAPCRPTADRRP